MQNLSFEDGYREFTVNGDQNRIVRFNPSDIGILERIQEAEKNINKQMALLEKDVKLEPDGSPDQEDSSFQYAAEMVGKAGAVIKEQVDYIFGNAVSEAAFGSQSPLSTVKGVFLFERFLNAVKPFIEKEVRAEAEASQKRMSKYQKVYHK